MDKYCNVASPCKPNIHYMLRATDRLPDVMKLIDQQLYFVLHAPRQTGKTTALLTLAQELTAAGRYAAVLVSMEVGNAFTNDPFNAAPAILERWRHAASWQLPAELQPPSWPDAAPGEQFAAALAAWAAASPRPLVVFLDEIDALRDELLISVLRSMDLCVEYGDVMLAIEVKAWRNTDNKRDPLDEGLVQLDEYLAKLGLDTGWLIIFDQRSKLPHIEERTSASEATTPSGRTVTVIRA